MLSSPAIDFLVFFFFKQKTAYERLIRDWSSDVCSSDLQPFATKSARFEPRSFDALPGWERDDLGEAAEGMRQSCAALRRKPVWGQLCRTFEHIDSGGNAALRDFFEQNFHVYQ